VVGVLVAGGSDEQLADADDGRPTAPELGETAADQQAHTRAGVGMCREHAAGVMGLADAKPGDVLRSGGEARERYHTVKIAAWARCEPGT